MVTIPFQNFKTELAPRPWWFCSCLAWKLLELLVLRFMLQLVVLQLSCLETLRTVSSKVHAATGGFAAVLSSVLETLEGIVTIHGDPSKSIINPRVPCCNSGGFAAVLLGNS